jgi:predicted dehydrogenase
MGLNHIKQLKTHPAFALLGGVDPDPGKRERASQELGISVFDSVQAVPGAFQAVAVATPTTTHFAVAAELIRKARHVFLEKPACESNRQAQQLEELAREADVVVQVGHVERFNPAFRAAQAALPLQPMFVESHRLAPFTPRGADVSVVLDLMIHDLDIILHTIKADVKSVQANGVSVISSTPDIANARLVFHNGAVANLTASRMSMKTMRKMRFFQRNAYVTVDFADRKTEIIEVGDYDPANTQALVLEHEGRKKQFSPRELPVLPSNALFDQYTSFAHAIEHRTEAAVSLFDAQRVLDVAEQIIERMASVRV